MSDSKCFSRVLCVLCCAVLMPMWRPWNQSSEDEPTLQQTAVHSLEELRAHVSRTLGVGWEDPGFYVYPDPDRRVEDRVRVDSDELLLKWEVKNAIFYAYPRTSKARTPPKDKSGLPLSIRTKRDREEAAELAAMVAARYAPPSSTSAESSTHNSPPRPTISSTTPPGLPKSPSPPIAARVLSLSPSSASSSSPLLSPHSSSPSSPSSSSSSTEKANKEATRYRDDNKCVVTDHSHQPNTQVGTALHCCHILNSSARIRQFNRGFIDFMKVHHPEVVSRYCDFIRPLSPEDMRRLKQHSAGSV